MDPAAEYWTTFSTVAASYAGTTPGGGQLADFVATHGIVFSGLLAGATAYLAFSFLGGFTTRAACGIGFALSAVLLWTQWGATFAFPGGTDVGAHPLYLVIYVVLVVGGAGRSWSIDRWIHDVVERRRLAGSTRASFGDPSGPGARRASEQGSLT